MRRIILVLALTALLVAVALAGSAGAQEGKLPPEPGCEGLAKADTTQEEAALPEAIPGETAEDFPGEGEEQSAVDDVEQQNRCRVGPD
jgi:hypothetical protein